MLEYIKTRRSIRQFARNDVDDKTVEEIIEMGTWAPSGLNNQPWKFVVIRDRGVLNTIAQLTRYTPILENAPVCIAVFLDTALSYHREKDIQAIGACIQNMLLTIHYKKLGAVWLGEILKNSKQVEQILEVPETLELMAVVALGHPGEKREPGNRKPAAECIIARK